ncbi:MAG: YafY family transcriptional regulator [Pseudomonadales bacterium]|nr:YafY family transcriptional regulator [Pseudomonadales bacterium]
MRKSDRLFQLTNILRAHQPVTAKHLAEKLSVAERTIYRYIDDLSVSGIPIYHDAGQGYRLSEDYELPPLQLTSLELEALISGVNFVAALTGKRMADPARSLLSKIEAALPRGNFEGNPTEDTLNSKPTDKQPIVWVSVSSRDEIAYQIWSELHASIESNQSISLTYKDANADITQRTATPLGLFYWGGKWTVGCWCHLRTAYRDFRLDRIQTLVTLAEHIELPAEVSLQAYINYQEKIS